MVKTHEKSRIYAVVGTDNVKNIEKVVLQMEATGQTSGGNYRRKLNEAAQENTELRKALIECRRIFGELPPEIERLLNNEEGEKDNGYTCTI